MNAAQPDVPPPAVDHGARVLARCDAAILGGGASGLLLASTLVARGWRGRRLVLIDDGRHPLHRRAWGFWATGTGLDGRGLLTGAISASWPDLEVQAAGLRLPLHLDPYRYHLVRGGDLRAAAAAVLGASPAFTQITARVKEVEDGPEWVRIDLGGQLLEARWVFDSRPPPPPGPGQPQLSFLGWEVQTPGPAFDPSVATLMDFRARTSEAVRFCYVLPTAPDRALIELTRFGWDRPTHAADHTALHGYLQDVLGLESWTVHRAEAADLPLGTPGPRRTGRRTLAIGRPAGVLKPSTGYGFQRAVRDAAAVSESLLRHGHPFALPRTRARHRLLDRLLLEVIRREPGHVETAMARLFAGNPPARVLRFLDEDSTRREELRLVRTLPAGPFLRAVARLSTGRGA